MWAYIRGPRKLEDTGASPPCDGGVADPLETHFSMTCYYAIFGHSRSSHTSVINGDPAEKFDP